MELLIIRHGESEADLLGVHEGRANFPLTELGIVQARKMAAYVNIHFPPNVILSSTLSRAMSTATILYSMIGCEFYEEPDLMEFNNGVLAGLPRGEAAIKYPLPEQGRPIYLPIEAGESELEFRYRAEYILHKIIEEYKDYQRVAIVSHGGMISNLIKAFLQLPVTSDYIFTTGDTGIHLLSIKKDKRIINFLNRLDHINDEKEVIK